MITLTQPRTLTAGRGAIVTLYCVASLTIMVGCVIVPGLPVIASALRFPYAASWLVTLPALGVVLCGRPAGRAIDRFGAQRSLCWGLLGYGALGAAGFLLRGPILLVADRLSLGGATAVVMASGTALISQLFSGNQRLTIIAQQGMAIEIGGVVFLSLGGWLAVKDWRLPFLLYLMAWIFLAMTVLFLPRGTATPGANRAVTPASESRSLRSVFAIACVSMVCFFIGVTTLPLRLHLLGKTEAAVGYFLSFVSLVAVCGASAMPRAVHRFGPRLTLTAAFAAYAGAYLTFASALYWGGLIAGGVLMGLGFGLSIPLVNYLTVQWSSESRRGRELAMLSAAIFLGQFLSSFLGLIPMTPLHNFIAASSLAGVAAALLAGTDLLSRPASSSTAFIQEP
jgi:MFS family permease